MDLICEMADGERLVARPYPRRSPQERSLSRCYEVDGFSTLFQSSDDPEGETLLTSMALVGAEFVVLRVVGWA